MCKFCEKEYILNFKLTFYLFLLQRIVIRTMLLFYTEFQDFWKTKNSVLTNSSGLAKSVRYNRDHGSVIEAYGAIRSFPCFKDFGYGLDQWFRIFKKISIYFWFGDRNHMSPKIFTNFINLYKSKSQTQGK